MHGEVCPWRSARIVAWSMAVLLVASGGLNAVVSAQQPATEVAPVQRVLDDYIGLYRKDSLQQWKTLFLPGFTAAYSNADGSVTTRTLEEFYERQRTAFERDAISETLENVHIKRAGQLAHVFADFHFTSGSTTRHGQLMLLMIEVKGQFRIAALTFTYDLR
jgi:hypothetical protein